MTPLHLLNCKPSALFVVSLKKFLQVKIYSSVFFKINTEFCVDEITPRALVAKILNPIRLPTDRFPSTTIILPSPITIIEDNNIK